MSIRPPATLLASDIPFETPADPHLFERAGDRRYVLDVPDSCTSFEIDRLYRDKQDLCGELVVTTQLKGAKTYNGVLFSGMVNLSNAYRRRDVVSHLKERARTPPDGVDWCGLLDEFSSRVIKAERDGEPAKLLTEFPLPTPDDVFDIHGIRLPKRHPSIIFGDGGTFKSYMALYIAGVLAQSGRAVLFADWELEGSDHRGRLRDLFGREEPPVFYRRYQRPMLEEAEGIARIVREQRIDYVIADSVGFATSGAPESSEAAMAYFRAIRQFGVGSLHLAHVTKQAPDAPDPSRPFGSTFWHNSARATWFMKRTDAGERGRLVLGVVNKKVNLGPPSPTVALEIAFGPQRTVIQRVDATEVSELVSTLPTKARMALALKDGRSLTIAQLAEETGMVADTVKKTLTRGRNREYECLTSASDGVHRWALLQGQTRRDTSRDNGNLSPRDKHGDMSPESAAISQFPNKSTKGHVPSNALSAPGGQIPPSLEGGLSPDRCPGGTETERTDGTF